MGIDVCLIVRGIVLAGKAVGVVPVRQQHHLDVHALLQQHVDAAQGSLDACHVAVIEHGDVVREAVDEAYLSRSEGRTRGSNHILDARLVHRDDVGVSLHQEATVLLDDGLLRKVDAVELIALVIDFRLGRIDILRRLGISLEDTSAEGHDLPRQGMDREDDPSPEAVAQGTVIAGIAQSRLHEVLRTVALQGSFPGKCIVLVQAIAQLELGDDVVAEAALAEIGHSDRLSLHMTAEDILEIVAGIFVDHEHALADALRVFLLIGQLALLHLDVVLVCQPLQRFVVGELFVLHDEVHHVASLSATEALAHAFRGRHAEGRCLLAMERTQPDVVHAPLAQGDKFRHHVDNLCGVHDSVYGCLVYHVNLIRCANLRIKWRKWSPFTPHSSAISCSGRFPQSLRWGCPAG